LLLDKETVSNTGSNFLRECSFIKALLGLFSKYKLILQYDKFNLCDFEV
jgi:hypothetical protein